MNRAQVDSQNGKCNYEEISENDTDSNDDDDGYYKVLENEILYERYEVQDLIGQGSYGTIVRARDLSTKHAQEIAIKINRVNKEKPNDAVIARREIEILCKLRKADIKDEYHCLRLCDYFEHKNHTCIVTEYLAYNLNEIAAMGGHRRRLNLNALKNYAAQLFKALRLLKQEDIVHCDIKPQNVLVYPDRATIKLCDFGSALHTKDCAEISTTDFVSLYYRSPEIILGLPLNFAVDVWALGCTLYYLYTCLHMFQGTSDNSLLKLIMNFTGKVPNEMIDKSINKWQHFDADYNFCLACEDGRGTKVAVEKMSIIPIKRDVWHEFWTTECRRLPNWHNKVKSFKDLLEKVFVLDTSARLTPEEALAHPFVALN